MVKLQLPDFVKAIAQAFKQVVTDRVMQLLSKGKDFAEAVKGMSSMAAAQPQPALVRATPRNGPPPRGFTR